MKRSRGYLYTLPLVLWILFFFSIPLVIIIAYSFMQKDIYGGVVLHFSLDAYRSLLSPILLRLTWSTLYMSLLATGLIMVMAVPTAYYIARSKWKNALLLLIIVPFWTNFLIRIYAWIAILGSNGFLNHMLQYLRIIENSVQFLYNPFAVILVLTYTYLPFAILPLYSTIEKFDFSLLEAARDLGATKAQSMFRVLLPNISSGIFAAFLFSFIPAFGAYAIPQLIGGSDSFMLGNMIARELTVTRNWPLSAAISTVITLITIVGIAVFIYTSRSTQTRGGNVHKA